MPFWYYYYLHGSETAKQSIILGFAAGVMAAAIIAVLIPVFAFVKKNVQKIWANGRKRKDDTADS